MGEFLNKLEATPLPDGKYWKLLSPLHYESSSGKLYIVNRGFITDGASVPKIFWPIIPPWGKYSRAAVLHDFLYRDDSLIPREEADDVFLEAMEADGVSSWKMFIMHRMVRAFGGIHKALKKLSKASKGIKRRGPRSH